MRQFLQPGKAELAIAPPLFLSQSARHQQPAGVDVDTGDGIEKPAERNAPLPNPAGGIEDPFPPRESNHFQPPRVVLLGAQSGHFDPEKIALVVGQNSRQPRWHPPASD